MERRLSALSEDKAKILEILIEKRSRGMREIKPYPRGGGPDGLLAPASWAQQRLWFIDQLEGRSEAYHIPLAMRLRGDLDRSALQSALQSLVERHEVLRTVFIEVNGETTQKITPEAHIVCRHLDLRDIGEHERDLELSRHAREELAAPFQLSVGPLIRGRLLQLAEDEHVLLIVMHHIVADGWSMAVFMRELGALYDAYRSGASNPLTSLPIQYADYAQWQREHVAGAELQGQLQHWQEHLQGAPELLRLPTDRPRPAVQSYRGDNVVVSIHSDLAAQLTALSRRCNVTLAMTLHTAWSILLARISGQEDIVVGVPVANRRRTEFEGLIGFFVNTLAVRVRMDDDPSLDALLERVKQVMLAAYANQDAPFEQVVEMLHPARSLDHSPIFQVMFVLQNAPSSALKLAGLTLEEQELPLHTAKFDLTMALTESAQGIVGNLNYASDLFDRGTIERWVDCYETVLRGMVGQSHAQVSSLPWFSDDERRRVLDLFNATQAPYPREKLTHQLFEEWVERTPAATAVVCGEESLTYAELNVRANRLARLLQDNGVGPDRLVGICAARGLDMLVGLLAVLKAGGAYVPLDPSYPAERLAFMLRDSAPVALLTQKHLQSMLPVTQARVIVLDACEEQLRAKASHNLDAVELWLQSKNLAYVIYTSGSTGTPKGVMVAHRSLVNLVQWTCTEFGVGEGSSCSAVAAIGFDAATWEIWPPLSVGGTLQLAPAETTGDVEELLSWWARQPVDISFLPTPVAEFVFSRNIRNPTLRALLIGGDRLRYRSTSESFSLINNYGPTEATVVATSGRVRDDDAVLHIGRPIANTRIYILDRNRCPVPTGILGELYIGGAGVALGYLNRPEQQAERFLLDPFSTEPHARMYRTGDLGRWRADGTIEFLGRNDDQVKIRGFRIELGEIEALLAGHPQVSEVAVVAREDVPGDKRLVAYVTRRDQNSVSAEDLRVHLSAALPEYMVPSAFVILDSLPLTPNGKVDRRALPAPHLEAYVHRQYEAPRGEVEEILAGIWQELLRAERVGRHDNFFELGGHSLLIVQMMERLRRVGLSAKVRQVFESQTLAHLASVLTSEVLGPVSVPTNRIEAGCAQIAPSMLSLIELDTQHIERIVQAVPGGAANVQDIYPLTPLQDGILFHHLMNERGGDTYVLPIVLSVASRARLDELNAALQAVIDRHDILRTAILWDPLPQPVQVVLRKAKLPVEEATLDRDIEPMQQIKEWMQPARQRMELRRAPLMRLKIAADPRGDRWYAMLQLHHITADHVGLEIVISEVVACMEGRAQHLPDPTPYRNHVAQALAYARTQDAEAFFRAKIGDIDEPTAPFGLVNVHGDGTQIADATELLEPALAQRIRAQARRLSVSTATVFHAAWALVVARTSRRDDVVFGTVLLGRLHGDAGSQRTLGMFINTLPLRLRLTNTTARELIDQTQRALVELLSHEQASLSVAQRCSGIVGSAPLFSALFNYRHNVANGDARWSSASGLEVLATQERTNYPITLSLDDLGEGFRLKAQTDNRIDPVRITAYLRTAVDSVVDALEQDSKTLALELPILPATERAQVIQRFNDTYRSRAHEVLIHALFEQQVERTPDAVAVVYEGQSLTYADLNARANQLARHLLDRGLGDRSLVGICVERSPAMIVGLLGILKAGAAYVPLDPNYPAERLQYMLEDAAPKVILAGAGFTATVPAGSETIELDRQGKEIARYSDRNLRVPALPHMAGTLVYVIFTSGSTGRPKGTAMSHGAMTNLIEWHREKFGGAEGQRVLQFAALSFDVAFQEVFSTLCTGGTLVLLDEWVRRDARALAELLCRQSIHRLFLPPLMLQALAEHFSSTGVAPHSLRHVITAGEQLRISPEISSLFKKLPGCELHNHYGPTETHVVTALSLAGNPDEWPVLPPIGQPIANSQIYILDARLQPLPIGVPGEIYIAGANVAQGYLKRPELTAQRFKADSFSTNPLARMYRTGDLGRWRADGTLEYLGRNDDQVKIRGFRIELGEIEAQLARHPQVKEAAVIAREDVAGERRLVAYVATFADEQPNPETLRAHLMQTLPEYMTPSAFVILERLPLTPSGKLDRRALPEPELGAYASRRYEAPLGEVEEAVAEIWRQLLRVERVGRNDNFFELGGHSLLATRVMSRIREMWPVEMPLRVLFDAPTVQQLALRIEAERDELAAPDTLRMFRQEIDEMHDDDVMARIAALEKELGHAQGG